MPPQPACQGNPAKSRAGRPAHAIPRGTRHRAADRCAGWPVQPWHRPGQGAEL